MQLSVRKRVNGLYLKSRFVPMQYGQRTTMSVSVTAHIYADPELFDARNTSGSRMLITESSNEIISSEMLMCLVVGWA
jgi:hypothetical protein